MSALLPAQTENHRAADLTLFSKQARIRSNEFVEPRRLLDKKRRQERS
jgi:hypothetical protein